MNENIKLKEAIRANEIEQIIVDIQEDKPKELKLDMEEFNHFSSDVLDNIVKLHKSLKRMGGELILINVKETPMELLVIVGLNRIIKIIRKKMPT